MKKLASIFRNTPVFILFKKNRILSVINVLHKMDLFSTLLFIVGTYLAMPMPMRQKERGVLIVTMTLLPALSIS